MENFWSAASVAPTIDSMKDAIKTEQERVDIGWRMDLVRLLTTHYSLLTGGDDPAVRIAAELVHATVRELNVQNESPSFRSVARGYDIHLHNFAAGQTLFRDAGLAEHGDGQSFQLPRHGVRALLHVQEHVDVRV